MGADHDARPAAGDSADDVAQAVLVRDRLEVTVREERPEVLRKPAELGRARRALADLARR